MSKISLKVKDATIKERVLSASASDRAFLIKERALFDALYKEIPDTMFWLFGRIKKVASLKAFLTSERGYIKKEYEKYRFGVEPAISSPILTLGDKSGEDRFFPPKIKTIKQFLSK